MQQYQVMIEDIMHQVVKVQDLKKLLRDMTKNKADNYVAALEDLYELLENKKQ